MENANKLLFRASSMGDIMSGTGKKWDVENSLTCKRKLIQIFRENEWQRRANKGNKYTEKGIDVEDDSITLYSRFKKKLFKKNTIRLNNDFFTGEVDLFEGEEITKATHIIDIKSCWDWTTFPSICDTLDSSYDYQGQTYMDLTSAPIHTIAYCLTNTPAKLIEQEKKSLIWKGIEIDTQEFTDSCIEIEKNCIYDMELFVKQNPEYVLHCKDWTFDIPLEQRVYEIDVLRDDNKINAMKSRVLDARNWMNLNLFSK